MELLETNNPKSELLRKSIQQRKVLQEEVKLFSDHTEKMITNALIVGGALALTYWIMRSFTSSSSKSKHKKQKSPGEEELVIVTDDDGKESKIKAVLSEVGSVLATQATAFLLALAKEKLTEFLAAQTNKEEKKNEHS